MAVTGANVAAVQTAGNYAPNVVIVQAAQTVICVPTAVNVIVVAKTTVFAVKNTIVTAISVNAVKLVQFTMEMTVPVAVTGAANVATVQTAMDGATIVNAVNNVAYVDQITHVLVVGMIRAKAVVVIIGAAVVESANRA